MKGYIPILCAMNSVNISKRRTPYWRKLELWRHKIKLRLCNEAFRCVYFPYKAIHLTVLYMVMK